MFKLKFAHSCKVIDLSVGVSYNLKAKAGWKLEVCFEIVILNSVGV